MPEPRKFGPLISQGDHDSRVFDFEWPVFEVELTDDPVEIRMGLDVTEWYARDPRSVAPNKWMPGPSRLSSGRDWELEEGPYLVVTEQEPIRLYRPLEEEPSILHRLLALKVHVKNTRRNEDLLGFVREFGLLGSTRRRGLPSARYGEVVKLALFDIRFLQDSAQLWNEIRPKTRQELTRDDWQSVLELIVDLNMILQEGVGPVLRSAVGEGGVRFKSGFTCRSLIHAAYLQLYLNITDHRAFGRCLNCENLFVQSRRDQNFCSKRCGNASRQRAFQKKKRGLERTSES